MRIGLLGSERIVLLRLRQSKLLAARGAVVILGIFPDFD